MLTIKYQTAFKKDYKRIFRRGYDVRLQEGFTACHEIGIDAAFCIQKRAVSLEEAMDRDAAMQNLTDTCKEAFRLVKAVVGVPQ